MLILRIDGVTVHSSQLLKAIRAQLSDTDIQIQEIDIDPDEFSIDTPSNDAAALSELHDSQMIFWIMEDTWSCSVFLYSSGGEFGSLYSRDLRLTSENVSSRFETIANAVSSMVEDVIVNQKITKQQLPSATAGGSRSRQVPPNRVAPIQTDRSQRYDSEVFTGYSSSYFSRSTLSHGIRAGLGLLLQSKFVADVSFTQNLTMDWSTSEYQFSVLSREFSASLARRAIRGAFEFRFGIAWITSLRSYEMESEINDIIPRQTKINAVHAIAPFFGLAWMLHKHFLVSLAIGSAISLNEKKYDFGIDNGRDLTTAVKPLILKPFYQVGIVIQM